MNRDLSLIVVGVALAAAGVLSTIFWSVEAGIVALFLFGLLLLFLGVLQRKHQSLLQQRVLYLISAEKKRLKSSSELDPISTKKIIGILQAQQISVEKLHSMVRTKSDTEVDDTNYR